MIECVVYLKNGHNILIQAEEYGCDDDRFLVLLNKKAEVIARFTLENIAGYAIRSKYEKVCENIPADNNR